MSNDRVRLEDPYDYVKPTMRELRGMRDRIDQAKLQLGPFGDPAARVAIREDILKLQTALRMRRVALKRRLEDCDRLLASVGRPWSAAGPSVPSIVWSLIARCGGRVRSDNLVHAAEELFGIEADDVWLAIKGYERRGLLVLSRAYAGKNLLRHVSIAGRKETAA